MFILNSISRKGIVLAFLLALSLLLGFNLTIIIISIYLIYHYNSRLGMSFLLSSRLLNIIVSFASYTLFLGCIVLGSWLLNHEFTLSFTPVLGLIILLATGICQYLLKSNTIKINKQSKVPYLHRGDIWSLLVATITVLVILVSSFISTAGSNINPYYGLADGNVDDAPHIGMINDRIQFDRGVLLHTDAQNESRFGDSGASYPIAWHAANAILIKSISPNIEPGQQTILYYVLFKTIWFFILVFLMTRFSFLLLSNQSKKKEEGWISVVWVLASALLFSFLFLVDIYREGFFSFIPQLISALVICAYLAAFISTKDIKDKLSILPVIIIIGIGGALSWVLILPAILILIIGIMIYSLKQKTPALTLKFVIPKLGREFISSAPICITLLGALLVQLYVMRFSASPLSFKESIVLPGGVAVYNDMFYIFLYIGTLASFIIAPKLKSLSITLIYSAAAVLVVAGLIFLIQLVLVGRTEYYYYKILHVATVMLIPLAIYGYYLLLKIVSFKSQFAAFSIILFLIMIVGQSAGKANIETFQYLSGERNISHATLTAAQSLIEKNSDMPYSSREVYVFDTALIDTHEIGTMLVKNSSPYSDCFTNLVDNYRYERNAKKTIAIVRQDCRVPVTIVTTPESGAELKSEATNQHIDSQKLQVKTLEDFN